MCAGGYVGAEVLDEEEAIFGTGDPSPKERAEARFTLGGFLLEGQKAWKLDGGVVVPQLPREPEMDRIWEFIVNLLKGEQHDAPAMWQKQIYRVTGTK